MSVFLQLFYLNGGKENKYYVFKLLNYVEKSKFFYLLKAIVIYIREIKMNVKQKTGFRWKCVLKSMFILLFTRINYEQSSIDSKISIHLATHVTIYFIR